MLRLAFWVVAGASALQLCKTLPGLPIAACAGGLALLCLAQSRWRLLRDTGAALLGFVVMAMVASWELADRLPRPLVGKDITLTVQIIDFPTFRGSTVRLIVRPLERPDLPSRLRLSWYDTDQEPTLGETWHLRVRLKRPRGLSNAGGFDSERYMHRARIGASGYVSRHRGNRRLQAHAASPVDRMRILAVQRIDRTVPPGHASAVMKAISVGARGDISDEQWRLYAQTGTSHLMAISGLHIGLAAGAAFLLAWCACGAFAWRHNTRNIALLSALLVGGLYALLSGWAVPAQRAFIMLLLATLTVLARRQVNAGHVLGCSCLAVLATDPLALYAPGFLLSFAAVGLLLWRARMLVRGRQPASWRSRSLIMLQELFVLQLVLLFGLLPLTVTLFGRFAWLAPAINLLALPVFNLVSVPFALLGLLLAGPAAPLGDLLLQVAWWSIARLLDVLAVAVEVPHASVEPALSGSAALLITITSVLYAVLPRSWPGRGLSVLALLATLNVRPPAPPAGCFDLRVFDVGQGLSAVVRTSDYVLIYDTGPAYRSGGNAARGAIGPWITQQGLRRVDLLIVSHGDLDHIGGADWLRSRIPVVDYFSGEATPPISRPCRAGQTWRRGGVSFAILHPETDWSGNNASCVLSVGVGSHRVLLTGDIEVAAERSLGRSGRLHPVDLVVVPHHGSGTSSSAGFIAELSPRMAVVSAGFGNRWNFPKDVVAARWRAAGAAVVSTADYGAISARYCAGQPVPRLNFEREQRRRYWHD